MVRGFAPLLLIIVKEVNAGIHLAVPEVVQELIAGRLVTTIV